MRSCSLCGSPNVRTRRGPAVCDACKQQRAIQGNQQRSPRAFQGARSEDRYNTREHREARARFTREVDRGQATCWRCGGGILPGTSWHVGHGDGPDRDIIKGPEHRSCNLRAAGQEARRRQLDADFDYTSGSVPTPKVVEQRRNSRVW